MLEEEYFDQTVLSKIKSFNEKWGDGWECWNFLDGECSEEDKVSCREAVEEINRSVVAPVYDAEWKKYEPHDYLLDNLAECRKYYQFIEGVAPRSVIEGKSNSATAISVYVRDLLNLATRHGETFHNTLKDIVLALNGEYKQGPQKRYDRILDKAKEDYGGDVSRVVDVERGTGIFDSSYDLANAVMDISDLSNRDPRFTVVRVKDAFSKMVWKCHYRDVKFSIKIEGLVGELKLTLRKVDLWNKKVHHVYSVERVIMNKQRRAPPRCGLSSVPALRFTRDDGVSIADGDCLHDLRKKLEKVLPKGCTFSGGYLSNDAINVYLGVTNIASFAKLRDKIILPNSEFDLAPFRADVGAFIDLYATNLMKFTELTGHQKEQLRYIYGADIALLLAPAGGGKTFVAIHCMLEILEAGDHILFAARNLPLALFVARWLVLASGKGAEKVVEKVRILIDDNDFKFTDGPLRLVVVKKGGRRVLTVKKPIDYISSFGIAVVDEAHHVIADAGLGEQLQMLKLQKYLFLGDASQSCMSKELTKESIREFLDLPDSRPIMAAKLNEVVRSTKRIVAGASSFQLTTASKTETRTHISSEGLPLVPHVFAPVSADERTKAYAYHIVKALKKIQEDLDDVNLDDRVMIICPDDVFVENLRGPLKEELRSQMKEKQYNLVSALDASAALPREPFTNTTDFPRWLVFDTINRVDGLERLAVIATGLDVSIQETEGDIQTRSAMYRALTRAQLAVAVVNEHVQGGFLEFLSRVNFDDRGAYNEKKVKRQLCSNVADEVQEKAMKKKIVNNNGKNSREMEISRRKKPNKPMPNNPKRHRGKMSKSLSPKRQHDKNIVNEIKNIQTSQSIWDTRLIAKNILKTKEIPKFMPFKQRIEMNEMGFILSSNTHMTLENELKNKRVTDINLSGSGIGADGVEVLAEALKVNTSLASIDLRGGVGSEGIRALADALKVNSSLLSTNLQNEIDAEGDTALAKALKLKTSFSEKGMSKTKTSFSETLNLNTSFRSANRNGINVNTSFRSANRSGNNVNASFRSANRSGNNVNTLFRSANRSGINVNTSFRSANRSGIGAEGATALAEALKVNTSLTNINLHCNVIGDKGAAALAKALEMNTSLTSISLDGNKIGPVGAMALSEALKVNTSLTNINLDGNKIGAEGATALAAALKVNRSLISISLFYNDIGDEGAKALAEALKVNTSVTFINLKHNKIGAEGASALAEALKRNTTVTVEPNYSE